MTRDEFIEFYRGNARLTREQYDKKFIAEPCTCGEGGCRGWASIYNEWREILRHRRHERILQSIREDS